MLKFFIGDLAYRGCKMVNVVSDGEYKERLKIVLSDHFDKIKQPVLVSLGLHLNGQTIEDVVNLLRKNGINAVPYYDEQVKDDLSCFVVDGTGIRTPFFKTAKDAKQITTDMFKIMSQNNIETSRAMPITRDNLIKAVTHAYTSNIIDIAQNNPNEENVDKNLSEYLKYAIDKMYGISISQRNDKDFTSATHIYRGGFLGDKPYAITFNRRYRDCAYGTNRLSEAIKYSQVANLGKGLQYKQIDGISYGFVYEFKQSKGQKFYDMAGAERPFATPEEKQTAGRPDYRLDYETLILQDRNPLSAIYLRVDDKLVQIADEKGYFKENGMNWEKFAKLHTPQNTSELNDYLVARMNKQIAEFPTFEYKKKVKKIVDIFKHKEQAVSVGAYNKILNVNGLTYADKIKKTTNGVELENVNLNSLTISEAISTAHLTRNLILRNCTMSPKVDRLDISDCSGCVCMADMEYPNIKPPKECNWFALSHVRMSKGNILDLSEMKCKKMTFEDVDLSAIKMIILPKEMDELKFRYNVKLSEIIDFGGAKNIIFDKTAKLDYSQSKQILASDNASIEVENITDKQQLHDKLKNKNINIVTRKKEHPTIQRLRDIIKQKETSKKINPNESKSQIVMSKNGRITTPETHTVSVDRGKTQQRAVGTEFDKFGYIKNYSYNK